MGGRNGPEYAVALSFAGEDRDYAEELAALLKGKGVRIFYDKYEQSQLWGKDLYQHLQKVYRDSAEYCVIFISRAYLKKMWTKHELKQAQERAFQENREYILPLKLDDTKLPGMSETTGYIDLRSSSIQKVADLLFEKLSLEITENAISINPKVQTGRVLGPGESYKVQDSETGTCTKIKNLNLYPNSYTE